MNDTRSVPGSIVVVGVGNLDRGDDAVGRIVARRLEGYLPAPATAVECSGGVTDMMEAIAGVDAAIVVDAVRSGAPPGHVHRIDVATTPLPASWFSASTHGFGVAEAIELGRTLGTLPSTLVFYGIESIYFSHGAPLTVGSSIDSVVTRILEDVAGYLATSHEADQKSHSSPHRRARRRSGRRLPSIRPQSRR